MEEVGLTFSFYILLVFDPERSAERWASYVYAKPP
jgi:hypothetical protein